MAACETRLQLLNFSNDDTSVNNDILLTEIMMPTPRKLYFTFFSTYPVLLYTGSFNN